MNDNLDLIIETVKSLRKLAVARDDVVNVRDAFESGYWAGQMRAYSQVLSTIEKMKGGK